MRMKKSGSNKKIGIFEKLLPLKNSTMVYGSYYGKKIILPFATDPRMVRVWLPPEYEKNPKKRFPVIYMSDGQNLVDAAYSAYGDWHLDRVSHELSEEGLTPPIFVGIDCPKDPLQRTNELNPPYPVKPSIVKRMGPDHPIGDRYIDYIADELKPYIDETFRTLPGKEYTGIGGSSMGGIMAFYAFFYRKDVFGFSLAYSIPFFFYDEKDILNILKDVDPNPSTVGKISMFVGGKGFEKRFEKGNFKMKKYLESIGYDEKKLLFMNDSKQEHHEEAWYSHSKDSLRFWLKDLQS